MRTPLYPILWIAGIAGATLIAASVDPGAYAGGRSRDDEERIQRNSSALATMLGEFRTSMSDIMFIKTERYLHGGVGYLPHHAESAPSAGDLADEVDEHQGELGIPDDDEVDDHSGTPTLIPAAGQDFRGFIGRLHREVKPWRDPDKPHIHTDGRELLPWFRIMTATDPHYVRGYVAGGFWVQSHSTEAALTFVEEGLKNNPDAFQLHVSRGLLLIKEARELGDVLSDTPDPAVRALLEQARQDFLRGAELALAQRPAGVSDEDLWVGGWGPYLEDDALRACLMAVTLTRNLGAPERAVELARRYLHVFPGYQPLRDAAE